MIDKKSEASEATMEEEIRKEDHLLIERNRIFTLDKSIMLLCQRNRHLECF